MEQIGLWSRSISNHLYWCAASSHGNGEELKEKWMSILNHCTNVHEGHGQHFQKCLHGHLEDRAWIKKGTLFSVVNEGDILQDSPHIVKTGRLPKIDPNFIVSFPTTACSPTFHKTNILHNDLKKDAIYEFGIKY